MFVYTISIINSTKQFCNVQCLLKPIVYDPAAVIVVVVFVVGCVESYQLVVESAVIIANFGIDQ